MSGVTPFQTIGPFFDVLLRTRARRPPATESAATRVEIEGALFDGDGKPVEDGFVEMWQAGTHGPDRPAEAPTGRASEPGDSGYSWSPTDDAGRFCIQTIRPGAVAAPDGRPQAPHLLVSVMARGILTRYITRIYFRDEAANDTDPILALVPPSRRATLIARRVSAGAYHFDIRLQGADETVFFDV